MTRDRRTASFAAAASLLLALGCGGDSSTPATPPPAPAPTPTPPPAPEPTPPAAPETATYQITYSALISGNPLFQALGATPFPEGVGTAPPAALIAHPPDMAPWELEGIASDGLKMLAETGDASGFLAEAEAAAFMVLISHSDQLTPLIAAPAEEDRRISLSHDFPCVTFAQRIAPSPDWFIGFSNVCAVDADGNWLEEVSLTSAAFDAGTAEGDTFELKAEGGDTDPRAPIAHLDAAPFSPPGTPISIITGTLVAQ